VIDHWYLFELSRALHIFRDFSIFVCAILTFGRVVARLQAATEATGALRRCGPQALADQSSAARR
jgi:hypothetical protein